MKHHLLSFNHSHPHTSECHSVDLVSQFVDFIFFIFFENLFVAILVSFCGTSYIKVVSSRSDEVPTKADFLAALLPLICIPALLSLCTGLLKWYVVYIVAPPELWFLNLCVCDGLLTG